MFLKGLFLIYQQDLASELRWDKEIWHRKRVQNALKNLLCRITINFRKEVLPVLSNVMFSLFSLRILKFFQKGWLGNKCSCWFRC